MWTVTATAAGGHYKPEIGQGSPMEWLLRSPELALMDLILREFVKNNVYVQPQPMTLPELKTWIKEASA